MTIAEIKQAIDAFTADHFTISDVLFFFAITFSASLFIYPNFRTNLWELILKKLKR